MLIANTLIFNNLIVLHTLLSLGFDVLSQAISTSGLQDFSLIFLSEIIFTLFFGDKRIGVILFFPPTILTFCSSLSKSLIGGFGLFSMLKRFFGAKLFDDSVGF